MVKYSDMDEVVPDGLIVNRIGRLFNTLVYYLGMKKIVDEHLKVSPATIGRFNSKR